MKTVTLANPMKDMPSSAVANPKGMPTLSLTPNLLRLSKGLVHYPLLTSTRSKDFANPVSASISMHAPDKRTSDSATG